MNRIFTSINCGPCRMLHNILQDRDDVEYISIDTDEGKVEAMSYGVSSTPTLLTEDLNLIVGLPEILKNLKV